METRSSRRFSHRRMYWAIAAGILISSSHSDSKASGCTYDNGLPSPLFPCAAGCTDLNSDGSVDFCDEILFASDFFSGNLRSDFYADGVVNLDDTAIFAQCLSSSPAPTGSVGTGTIGVYFDAAGTTTQLNDVTFGSPVTVYIVAHGLPLDALSAYTFELDLGGLASALSEIPPASTAGSYGLAENNPSYGKCSRGAENFCMPIGGTVLLMTYTFPYLPLVNGPVDTIIGVQGLHGVQATSWALPAYVSCNNTCQVTYIPLDPATNGRAAINPTDYNNNGLADAFEVAGTRWYYISGTSTGISWMTSVQLTDGSFVHDEVACGPVTSGSPASAIVAELVAKIDAIGGDNAGPEAGLVSISDNAFWVSVPGGTEFELGVGAATATYPGGYCWSPPSHFCEFNPVLTEVMEPTSSVPMRPGFNLANHPNPFNPGTTISFTLPEAARVALEIYDLRGGLVRTLLDGQTDEAGSHEVRWDGRDARGNTAAAGVYLYRLQAGTFSEARSMMLVK